MEGKVLRVSCTPTPLPSSSSTISKLPQSLCPSLFKPNYLPRAGCCCCCCCWSSIASLSINPFYFYLFWAFLMDSFSEELEQRRATLRGASQGVLWRCKWLSDWFQILLTIYAKLDWIWALFYFIFNSTLGMASPTKGKDEGVSSKTSGGRRRRRKKGSRVSWNWYETHGISWRRCSQSSEIGFELNQVRWGSWRGTCCLILLQNLVI